MDVYVALQCCSTVLIVSIALDFLDLNQEQNSSFAFFLIIYTNTLNTRQ